MSTLQLDQIHLLLDTWLRNMDDVAANEEGILVTLQGSLPDSRSPLNTAKLFDKTEDMLTADALRLAINLSLTMGLVHSVLTPFQCASFLAAAHPHFCDWISLAKQLAAKPLPAA